MAKIKPKEADASSSLDRFGGLSKDANLASSPSATLIRNFRITPSGDLEKREGFEFVTLPVSSVRGIWQGETDGLAETLLVSGNRVYRTNRQGGADAIGTLSTSSGDAQFFSLGDSLYLMDGRDLYARDAETGTFAITPGYAPLYGKDWHPSLWGTVNEPINLLSSRVRIEYRNSIGTDTYTFPFFANSVDAVLVDGVRTSHYTLVDGTKVIVPGVEKDSVVMVALTAYGTAMAEGYARVASSRGIFPFRTERNKDTVLLYGGENGQQVFPASPVDPVDAAFSRYLYPDSSALYFKTSNECFLGDSEHPVTGFCQTRGRMLGFTTEGTYAISFNAAGNDPLAYRIDGSVGCVVLGGVTVVDRDPILVGEEGVLRLSLTTGQTDAIAITNLSESLWTRPDKDLLTHACLAFDPVRRELWVRNRDEDEVGICQILQVDRGQWYEFDGIDATSLFYRTGAMHFLTSRGKLCRMNPRLYRDGSLPIVSIYRSGYTDFSSPEANKRVLRATVEVEGGRSGLNLTVYTERAGRAVRLTPPSQLTPAILERRFNLGRFRLLSFRLDHAGNEALTIRRVHLYTKF